MTDPEIKTKIKTLLDDALESCNEDGCGIEVLKIDRENGKVVVEFSLVIIEEDNYAGFSGY